MSCTRFTTLFKCKYAVIWPSFDDKRPPTHKNLTDDQLKMSTLTPFDWGRITCKLRQEI